MVKIAHLSSQLPDSMKRQMMEFCCVRFLLAIVSLLYSLSSTDSQSVAATPGITVTPDRDQAVPFASDENVTYTCEVDGGRTAVWEVSRRQILGQELASVFADSGIFVEGLNSNFSVIHISAEARRNASLSSPPEIGLLCVAAEKLKGTQGRLYTVFTYDPPIPPLELILDLVGSAPNSALTLIWDRPINVDQRINIVYTVEINSTMEGGRDYTFVNITDTSLVIDFPEALHSNKSCQMYEFFVTAINGAGSSHPARYLETLPITTDVTNISQSLTVNSVDVRSRRGLAFIISFETLKSCSENFPILNYTVMVDNITSEYTIPFPSLPPPGQPFSLKLNDSLFPELDLGTMYSVRVNACSEFSCKQSDPTPLLTSDLQLVRVTIFERNIFISCSFANRSLAIGCSVRLRLLNANDSTSDDVFELRRPQGAGQNDVIVATQCNETTNQRVAYDDIVGVELREGGAVGEVVLVAMETMLDDGRNFTQSTGCSLPQQATDSGGNFLALAIALPLIIVITLALVTTLTLIFVLVHFKQRRSIKQRPTIETDHDDEEDCVVCEVKFKTDEFSQLLRPRVTRSASAPMTITASTKSPPSSESSSQTDNVFTNTGQLPALPKDERPKFARSVSDNYQGEGYPYELELGKRTLKVKLNRQGLKQYAGRRTLSEGGSGAGQSGGGLSGDYPRVSSRLKISEDLHGLLNLDTLLEESEPTSPVVDEADGEERSLIVPDLGDGASKKSSSSPSSVRSGINFRSKEDRVTGL